MRTIVAIFFSIVVVLLSLLIPHYGLGDIRFYEFIGAIVLLLGIGFLVTFSVPQEQIIRIVHGEKEKEKIKYFE